MDRSPIYDSVFKTMAEKMPELLVPLVNEAFGTAYPEDAPVTRLGEEHAGKRKRIVDAAFRIEGRTFHIECQSSWGSRRNCWCKALTARGDSCGKEGGPCPRI